MGPSASRKTRSQRETSGAKMSRQASPSVPRRAAVASTERSRTTALPSSNGCASGASGWTQRSPNSDRRIELKNGDAAAIGWNAEHTSWTKPGRVSAAERVPPPISSFASYTVTDRPERAIAIAAAKPFGPAPTTTASGMLSRTIADPCDAEHSALRRVPRHDVARPQACGLHDNTGQSDAITRADADAPRHAFALTHRA